MFATIPNLGLNLILLALGDKAIILPVPQPPTLQNKNSLALYNQLSVWLESLLISSNNQPSLSKYLP